MSTNDASNVPGYERFRDQMAQALREAGVPCSTEDRSRFSGITSNVNGHRSWVAKTTTREGVFEVHTTIEVDAGKPVTDNGKIRRILQLSLASFKEHLLPRMADQADRLPESRRQGTKTTTATDSFGAKKTATPAAPLHPLSGLEAE